MALPLFEPTNKQNQVRSFGADQNEDLEWMCILSESDDLLIAKSSVSTETLKFNRQITLDRPVAQANYSP